MEYHSSQGVQVTPKHNLMDLPTELHLQISSYLPYPDALALKHTNRHFSSFVYTGIYLKVDWLLERFHRKLDCPKKEGTCLRTDESFCNKKIRQIMERRRRHLECRRVKGGCLVVEGQSCQRDLVPIWLKGQRRAKMVRKIGNEVLILGLIFLCINLIWNFGVRLLV